MREGLDGGLVALVERPLPDALGGDQPGPGERLQVGGGGWLRDPELVGDEHHADPVVDEVSVALKRTKADVVLSLRGEIRLMLEALGIKPTTLERKVKKWGWTKP